MERKIGETFEFEGKWLKVKEEDAKNACRNCYLVEKDCSMYLSIIGECLAKKRSDSKGVVFEDITYELEEQPQELEQPQEEQPQEEQPQKLNLCEILKDCPQGETFWSPMLNGVKFSCIDEERQMIIVETVEGHFTWEINHDGTISIDEVTSPEIMLYPSREQRDWTKVKYEKKKERFDPKTLKPFDRVLSRFDRGAWSATLFSHLIDSRFANKKYNIICCGSVFGYCIPYNDDTKHLVGTKDEAPDFYKYWED